MSEKKMTKREAFAAMIEILNDADRPELVAFLEKQIDQLNAAKSSLKKPTKEQLANAELIEDIKNWMSTLDHPVSIADMMNQFPDRIKSGQHANALMIGQRKAGEIRRVYQGKNAFYELGDETVQ